MKSKYFLIPIIAASLFIVGISAVATTTTARTLEIQTIFINPTGDNSTALNGTRYILNGTDDEIRKQYYVLGEEFNKQGNTTAGDSIMFIFKNGSTVTETYTGKYRGPGADQLIEDVTEDVTIPIGEPGDKICWVDTPHVKTHWVCGGKGGTVVEG
jgi:hypothetical protein